MHTTFVLHHIDAGTAVSVDSTQEEHVYVNDSVPTKFNKPVPAKYAKRKCIRHRPTPDCPDAAAATSTPAESNQETNYEVISISELVPHPVSEHFKQPKTVQEATTTCTVPSIRIDKFCNSINKRSEKHELPTSKSFTERPSTLEHKNPSYVQFEEWIKSYTVEKITRNTTVSYSNNFKK